MNEDETIPDDSTKIKNISIISEMIANNSITSEKIFNKSITGDKISEAAISTEKIADNNITTEKIKDAAITNVKIKDQSITSSKLDRNLRLDGMVSFSSLSPNKLVIVDKDKVLRSLETIPNSIVVLDRDNNVTLVKLDPNRVVRTTNNGLPTTNENTAKIPIKFKGDVTGEVKLYFDYGNEITLNLSQNMLNRLSDIESNVGIVRANPSNIVDRLSNIEITLDDLKNISLKDILTRLNNTESDSETKTGVLEEVDNKLISIESDIIDIKANSLEEINNRLNEIESDIIDIKENLLEALYIRFNDIESDKIIKDHLLEEINSKLDILESENSEMKNNNSEHINNIESTINDLILRIVAIEQKYPETSEEDNLEEE